MIMIGSQVMIGVTLDAFAATGGHPPMIGIRAMIGRRPMIGSQAMIGR